LVTSERRFFDFHYFFSTNEFSVFLDNGYYNKAIAASPVHALPGYIMGGISWFAIPWLIATTMGLAGLALESNPVFPTYPNRMTSAEVSAGLVVPYAAVALLGSGGAVATLLIVFMAVTSASSAELIAVSSIFTYDIYQTYFEPTATGKKLIYMSHAMVIGFGLFMASFSVGCELFPPQRDYSVTNTVQCSTPVSAWVTSMS
jgi:Na+/proline symporter